MSDNAATTVLLEMEISDEKYTLHSPIVSALVEAETELDLIDETIGSIEKMKPDCDKTDYILSACSGTLCGIMDVFLVGKAG